MNPFDQQYSQQRRQNHSLQQTSESRGSSLLGDGGAQAASQYADPRALRPHRPHESVSSTPATPGRPPLGPTSSAAVAANRGKKPGSKLKKMVLDDNAIIEELNTTFGFPEIYYQQNKRGSEWAFSGKLASEGYRDSSIKDLKLYPYGSFITTSDQDKVQSFLRGLELKEHDLRESWKRIPTLKNRDERKQILSDALRSSDCREPRIGFPRLHFMDDADSWLSDSLADFTKPLRDLSDHMLPVGFRIRSREFLQKLAERRVPVLRAVWFIKVVANYPHADEKSAQQLAQQWTETVMSVIDWIMTTPSQPVPTPSSLSASAQDTMENGAPEPHRPTAETKLYYLELFSHCLDEGLFDRGKLTEWLVAKLNESCSQSTPQPTQQQPAAKGAASGSTSSLIASWFKEVYFASPKALSCLNIDGIVHSLVRLLAKGNNEVSSFLTHLGKRLLYDRNLLPDLFQSLTSVKADEVVQGYQAFIAAISQKGSTSGDSFSSTTSIIRELDKFYVHCRFDTLFDRLFAKHIQEQEQSAKGRQDGTLIFSESFKQVIFTCIRWSCSKERFEQTRTALVATLLERVSKKLVPLRRQGSTTGLPPPLQDLLFEFIGTQVDPTALSHREIQLLCVLYTELVRTVTFSHGEYMRTLIARGIVLFLETSIHRHFVENIFTQTSIPQYTNMFNQRNQVLYHMRHQEQAIETEQIVRLKEELAQLLGTSVQQLQLPPHAHAFDSDAADNFLKRLQEASIFVQFHVSENVLYQLRPILRQPIDARLATVDLFERRLVFMLRVMYTVGDHANLVSTLCHLIRSQSPQTISDLVTCLLPPYFKALCARGMLTQTLTQLSQHKNSRYWPGIIHTISVMYPKVAKAFPKQLQSTFADKIKLAAPGQLPVDLLIGKREQLHATLMAALRTHETLVPQTQINTKSQQQPIADPLRLLPAPKDREVASLLLYCLEQFDTAYQNRADPKAGSTTSNIVTLIRELCTRNLISSDSKLLGAVASLILVRCKATAAVDMSSLQALLMVLFSRGIVSLDQFFNNVVTCLKDHFASDTSAAENFVLFLRKLLLVDTVPDGVSPWFKALLGHYQFLFSLLSPFTIANIIKTITSLASVTATQSCLSLLRGFVCLHCTLATLSCKPKLLIQIFQELDRVLGEHRLNSAMVNHICSDLLSVQQPLSAAEPLQRLKDVIDFATTHGSVWSTWLHSSTIYIVMGSVLSSSQGNESSILRLLVAPLLVAQQRDEQKHPSHSISSYTAALCAQVKQYEVLKRLVQNEFTKITTKFLAALQQRGDASHALAELTQTGLIMTQGVKIDPKLAEIVFTGAGKALTTVLHLAQNASLFVPRGTPQQQQQAPKLDVLQRLAIACLKLLIQAQPHLITVPYDVMRTLFSALSHKISRVSLLISEQDDTVHDLALAVLSLLHWTPKLHHQILQFYEVRHKEKQQGQDKQTDALPDKKKPSSWKIIEDYEAFCQNCRGRHGTLTPCFFFPKEEPKEEHRTIPRSRMLFEGQAPILPAVNPMFITPPQVVVNGNGSDADGTSPTNSVDFAATTTTATPFQQGGTVGSKRNRGVFLPFGEDQDAAQTILGESSIGDDLELEGQPGLASHGGPSNKRAKLS